MYDLAESKNFTRRRLKLACSITGYFLVFAVCKSIRSVELLLIVRYTAKKPGLLLLTMECKSV